VRLAALNLEEISGSGSGWSRARIGDSENIRFHLNSRVLTFHRNVTFLCNSTRVPGISVMEVCVAELGHLGIWINE